MKAYSQMRYVICFNLPALLTAHGNMAEYPVHLSVLQNSLLD